MAKVELSRTIEASEVAVNCDAVLEEIMRTGKGVLVTKNGKAHVELLPHHSQKLGSRKVRQPMARRRRSPVYRGPKPP
jgi:hypothetical protein